ncbi:MAG: ectoine/hydroxyectoine ABC transporter permease subunit EhuC [Nocardioidaceae bacterium]
MDELQFGEWVGPLLDGLWVTVYCTVLGAVLALVIALVLGLSVRVENIVVRTAARTIIELFRGTSLLVQLFFIYYAFPQLTGVYGLPAVVAGVVALGLNFGAYGAEVVRGAINAVPPPQWEGSIALNLTPAQRMRRVILPQALPLMIPPFGNLLIQLLKSTPLVYLISIVDLYTVGTHYWSAIAHPAFVFGLLLVVYFVLAYLTTLGMHAIENRAKARLGRAEERRSLFGFKGPVAEEAEQL